MANSVNTTPLLQEWNSDSEEDLNGIEQEVVVKDNKSLLKPLEPRDKYYMAYLIFYLLGVVTLLPWNFFITADDYWMYKFRDVNKTSAMMRDAPQKRTPLQVNFVSYLNVCSSGPTLVFLILNSVLSHRISVNKRMLGSLIVMFILFIFTLVLVSVNTDSWQHDFFYLTLGTIVLLNICSAIMSGTLYGIMGKFSSIYITAMIGGQALGGIFAAIAEIISLSIGASPVHSAYVYFTIGAVTILVSIVLYIVLYKSLFYTHHMHGSSDLDEFQSQILRQQPPNYKVVLKKVWGYGFTMFACFAISLAVYPGVTVLVESEGKGQGSKWNDVFFVPTINYLLFNIGDYLGRIISGRLLKPKSGLVLSILCLSRFIFIPLLLLCNAHPRTHWAVVFDKDYQFIIILFLCAITNGYMANISTIHASRYVEHHEKELASTLVSVFMGVGLALGSILCLFMVKLL